MRIEINTSGVIKYDFAKECSYQAKTDTFPSGEGVYALEDNGVIIGLIYAYNLHTDRNGEEVFDIKELVFPVQTVVASAIYTNDQRIKEYIKDCFDNVLGVVNKTKEAVEEANECFECFHYQYQDDAASLDKSLEKLLNEGIGGSGVSEKTLISALEIVSKNK